MVAALGAQDGELVGALDALGDTLDAQQSAELDQRVDDRLRFADSDIAETKLRSILIASTSNWRR